MKLSKEVKSSYCCYGYVRVSTINQTESGSSIEDQTKRIKGWADMNDMKLMGIYTDKGVSGTFMFERPEFKKMIGLVQKGDTLVANDLSRVSRNGDDMMTLVRILGERGARAVFIADGLDTSTKMGKFMIKVTSMIKEMEVQQSAERVADTMAVMKERGQNVSKPPYGWTKSSPEQGSSLIEVPEQQAIIARMRALYEAGSSFRGIARLLTNEEIPSPGGKRWNDITVKSIIMRENVATKGRYDK